MDAYLAVASKRDQRKYAERPVPEEAVSRSLDAGRVAGSAKNRQPWRFLVLGDRGLVAQVAQTVYAQPDPVAKATRSRQARRKAQTKRTRDGLACQSFRDLLSGLAQRTRNTIRVVGTNATFDKLAEPNALQRRALALIEGA